jgi:hypothetical protein
LRVAECKVGRVVGGDDRQLALGKPLEQFVEPIDGLEVQIGGRFVEQQQGRIGTDGGGQFYPLLHARRKKTQVLLAGLGQLQQVEHGFAVEAGQQRLETDMEVQRLFERELLDEFDIRRGIRNLPINGIGFERSTAVRKGDFALGKRRMPRKHPHQGGLARTVGANDGRGRARPKLVAQAPEYPIETEAFACFIQRYFHESAVFLRRKIAYNLPKNMLKSFISLLLLFAMHALGAQQTAQVADQTFKVDGVHEFYYAFAEGDQVELMVQLIAGRRLKTVEIIGLPDNTLFRSYELDTALTKSVAIPSTGAYLLRITEQGLGKKICRFTLARSGQARIDTRIQWDMKEQPNWQVFKRSIQTGVKTEIYSLSGQVMVPASNMGIKNNRTSYRFELPTNTTRWAYRIGVSQDVQAARQRDATQFNDLVRKGATKVMAASPETALAAFALGMAVQLTTSTGSEDIEYALVDTPNLRKFLDGESKYDAHIWQGSISVDAQRRYAPLAGTYGFALKNNNYLDDVNVSIDIEAITETPQFTEEFYLIPR